MCGRGSARRAVESSRPMASENAGQGVQQGRGVALLDPGARGGAPPHARGPRSPAGRRHARPGNTPARAGTTRTGRSVRRPTKEHPRTCGDHLWMCGMVTDFAGTPPQAAGTTWSCCAPTQFSREHPRTRGALRVRDEAKRCGPCGRRTAGARRGAVRGAGGAWWGAGSALGVVGPVLRAGGPGRLARRGPGQE